MCSGRGSFHRKIQVKSSQESPKQNAIFLSLSSFHSLDTLGSKIALKSLHFRVAEAPTHAFNGDGSLHATLAPRGRSCNLLDQFAEKVFFSRTVNCTPTECSSPGGAPYFPGSKIAFKIVTLFTALILSASAAAAKYPSVRAAGENFVKWRRENAVFLMISRCPHRTGSSAKSPLL
jgi:hypothetical protein